jgi:hypothetical protein
MIYIKFCDDSKMQPAKYKQVRMILQGLPSPLPEYTKPSDLLYEKLKFTTSYVY